MNIFRYDDVSLLLMMELGQMYGQKRVPLSDIAVRHGISPLFLKKIARTLIAQKLIKSREGKYGGYELNLQPSQITLWDVMESFSNRINLPLGVKTCPLRKNCLPQQVHNTIDRVLEKSFSGITLADLIGGTYEKKRTQN